MNPNRQSNKQVDQRNDDLSQSPFGWRQLVWILVVFLFSMYWLGQAGDLGLQQLNYSEFKQQVAADKVERVTLKGQRVTGIFRTSKDEVENPNNWQDNTFETILPPVEDPQLIPLLEKHNVSIAAEVSEAGWLQTLFVSFLPLLLIVAIFYFASRSMRQRMGGGEFGLFNFGKSKARRFLKGSMDITFDNVAGLENAKRDLHEIIDYLKQPNEYLQLGAKIPRGILLMGPPGTGKTLLSKAVAGEADVPFFSISGSEFVEMFVGVGASRVRDMFAAAKKEAPAIIFIDEIDSVGRTRGTGLGGGHDEREQTLNQILAEMDGFSAEHTVVVLAATNRPDVLDPALLRPGRFDRKVTLELPLKEARRQILAVHTRQVPLDEDVDLDDLASRTAGFSGADLENLVNEAALLTGRERWKQVTQKIFEQARDKIVLGAERENILSAVDKKRIAYHEAGHALLACVLPHADPLAKVTIIPRGRSLGATEQSPVEERTNLPESYLLDRIALLLGGRVAERIIFDEISSGAEDDIKQATRVAQHMVGRWGMSEKIGPVAFRRGEEHIFLGREMAQQKDFSEHTAHLIDDEVRKLVGSQEELALRLLSNNRERLEELAQALLEKEILSVDEVRAIVTPTVAEPAVDTSD
jgi:cell division protease FtsH